MAASPARFAIPGLLVLALGAAYLTMSGVDTGPEVPDRPIVASPKTAIVAPKATSASKVAPVVMPRKVEPAAVRPPMPERRPGRQVLQAAPGDAAAANAGVPGDVGRSRDIMIKRTERVSKRFYTAVKKVHEQVRWDDDHYREVSDEVQRADQELADIRARLSSGGIEPADAAEEMLAVQEGLIADLDGLGIKHAELLGDHLTSAVSDAKAEEEWDGIPFEDWVKDLEGQEWK